MCIALKIIIECTQKKLCLLLRVLLPQLPTLLCCASGGGGYGPGASQPHKGIALGRGPLPPLCFPRMPLRRLCSALATRCLRK